LICAALGLYLGVASAAYAYSRSRETWTLTQVLEERASDDAYRRLVTSGDPIDQNAAVWYRRSFAKLRFQRPETASMIAAAVARHSEDDAIVDLSDRYCSEVRSQRVHQALLCTTCKWEIESLNADAMSNVENGWTLGNCLVLVARVLAIRGDPGAAGHAYIDALAFASDLAQADYATNLVGMSVARSALEGLARLLGNEAIDLTDPATKRLFDFVANILERLKDRLPTVNHGLRSEFLRMADRTRVEPRTRHRWSCTVLCPRLIAAAWQLRREQTLLNVIIELSETGDFAGRERLAKQADAIVRHAPGKSPVGSTPEEYLNAVVSEEYVRDIFDATRAVVELQNYHVAHGAFPARLPAGTISSNRSHVLYKSVKAGAGCELVINQDDGSRIIFGRQGLQGQ
jgi:hypothetical protein